MMAPSGRTELLKTLQLGLSLSKISRESTIPLDATHAAIWKIL
jgi:hypothetical protein